MKDSPNKHLPNFANLAVAILEAKIESVIGKAAIKEIKSPLLNKELEEKLLKATSKAETRLVAQYTENEIADALKALPVFNLPSVKAAIWAFYNNPTNPEVLQQLESQMKLILPQGYPQDKFITIAQDYLRLLWEEASSLDEMREKLSVIATIRTERHTEEISNILHAIDKKLSSLAISYSPGLQSKNDSLLAPLPIPPTFAHAQSIEIHWTNRVHETKILLDAWREQQVQIVGLIGLGGIGKSALARRYFDELYKLDNAPDGFFWWSFYYQPSLDEFLDATLRYLSNNRFRPRSVSSPWAKIQILINLMALGRFVLVLDGLEVMQNSQEQGDDFGRLTDRAFRNLIMLCSEPNRHKSLFVITSRFPLTDLDAIIGNVFLPLRINSFSDEDATKYLKRRGIHGRDTDMQALCHEYGGHALSLALLASYLEEYFDGQIEGAREIPFLGTVHTTKVNRLLEAYNSRLGSEQRALMQLLSTFRRPISDQVIKSILHQRKLFNDISIFNSVATLDFFEIKFLLGNLEKRGLISREKNHLGEWNYTSHLLIREYFLNQLAGDPNTLIQVNQKLCDFVSNLPVVKNPEQLDDLAPMFDVVYYNCQAKRFDEAARYYQENVSQGHWQLGFKFGAYEFQISLLREFFPNRDLDFPPLVEDPAFKTLLLLEVAYCFDKLGQPVQAATFCERAAIHALESSDYKNAAAAYQGLSGVIAPTGKLLDAQDAATKALHYAQISGEKRRECNSLAKLGWCCFLKGETEKAEQYYQEANSLKWSEDPDEFGLFSILGVQFGTFLMETGRLSEAWENAERNLKICERKGWKESIAYCKRLLGDLSLTSHDLVTANICYTEALDIARNMGIQEQIARILLGLAKISMTHANYQEALLNLEPALAICLESGLVITEVDILNCYSEINLLQNYLSEAEKKGKEALELANTADYAWGRGTTLHILEQVASATGRTKP